MYPLPAISCEKRNMTKVSCVAFILKVLSLSGVLRNLRELANSEESGFKSDTRVAKDNPYLSLPSTFTIGIHI